MTTQEKSTMTNIATISELRGASLTPPPAREAALPAIKPGFDSLQSFELMQRAAKAISSSTLVPAAYRSRIEKLDKYGNVTESRENPNALPNCMVALNMAARMGADPLMIMQNLFVIEGRPSWSAQFIIAAINGCGRFSPLRFDMTDKGEREVSYTVSRWENGQRSTRTLTEKIRDRECIAWAIEKETGERVSSPAVTMEMAVKEGWYQKSGSKWQTMPDAMLRYRAAAFFGRIYAPELLMGLRTADEQGDIIDISPDGEPDIAAPVPVSELRTQADAATPEEPARRRRGRPPKAETVAQASNPIPADEKPAETPPEPPAADAETGELLDMPPDAEAGIPDADARMYETAIAAAKAGRFDEAMDLGRDLPESKRAALNIAISNLRETAGQ
jgi:hypothetical protein